MADTQTGMMNPYEFSKRVSDARIQTQGVNDLIESLGQQVFQEQTSKPQFVVGTKTASEILAEKTAALEKEQKIAEVRTATDWDNLQIILGQDLAQLAHQQRNLSAKVVEDSAVSLFDDPLTAIVNAFTLPWDQQALDGVEQKIDSTNKAMQSVNNHVQQSAQTADIVTRKMTAGIVADTAAALESHAKISALQAKMKAAADGSARLQNLLSLDKEQLHAYTMWKNAQDQDEARAQRKKEFDLRYSKMKDVDKGEETANYYANLALAREGRKPLNVEKLAALKGTAQQYFAALVQKGMKYEIAGDAWNWGDTIQERLGWMQTIGKRVETPQAESVIQEQYSTFTAPPAAGVTDAKAWAAGADARFAQKFVEDQYKIKEGSPFEAPAYSVLMQHSPQIVNHVVWRDYIHGNAAVVDPQKAINPQLVVNSTIQAMRDGKIRQPEARAFILQLTEQMMGVNNEVHNFERITGGLRQKAFGVQLKTGAFGGSHWYDLSKPEQIDLALAESMSAGRGTRVSPFAQGTWR